VRTGPSYRGSHHRCRSEYHHTAKKLCQALAGLSWATNQVNEGDNGCMLGDVLWWMGLLLGGGVWIGLLALAHSAGPIDEAVFWASLIAVLPIGFGYLCRYMLSAKITAAADTDLDPAALPQAQNATIESRSRPGSAQTSMGRGSQRKGDAAAKLAAAVKRRSSSKSSQKSTSVVRHKKWTRLKVRSKRRVGKAQFPTA